MSKYGNFANINDQLPFLRTPETGRNAHRCLPVFL